MTVSSASVSSSMMGYIWERPRSGSNVVSYTIRDYTVTVTAASSGKMEDLYWKGYSTHGGMYDILGVDIHA